MREIKFRAWDKEEKKMKFVVRMNLEDNSAQIQNTSTDPVLKGSTYVSYKWVSASYGYFVFESGIKAKSGGIKPLELVYDIEVIGNIYENPELLKEEK